MLTNQQLIDQYKKKLQQFIDYLRNQTQPATDIPELNKIKSVRYDSDQKIHLASLVEQLIDDIDISILKQSCWIPKNEHKSFKDEYAAYAARLLNQVLLTIQEPNKVNCNKLQTIANSAKGNSTWVKVGVVLSIIVGALLGLFPGIIVPWCHEDNRTWDKRTQRQSFASNAKAILPITRSFSRFFKEPAPIVAKEQLAANDNVMLPPVYEDRLR